MTAIETQGLTKRYGSGDDAVLAVDGLDLTVEEGEVFGFLGPNGAGKSTTIDMLLDYGRPTSGTATVLGLDAQDDSEQLRERIGVLPEGYGLYDRLTGRRHLEFAVEWQDADDDPDEILDRVGLDDDDAARPVGDYSKGMQQRLGLGMALVGQPDLLILDEPSSGLDPIGIREMRDIVRAEADRGATVFFSSHIMSEVRRSATAWASSTRANSSPSTPSRGSGRPRARARNSACVSTSSRGSTSRRWTASRRSSPTTACSGSPARSLARRVRWSPGWRTRA
jgi:ABC-2 type transport system ATP-binding protein